MSDILTNAVNDAVKENPKITQSMESFFDAVSKEFVKKKVEDFPRMIDVARMMNLQKKQQLEKYGFKGKYTDTYGWSKDGTMFDEFEIPEDLYHFMRNMVYKRFWDEDNAKVWRPFMKKICSRYAPMTKYDADNLLLKLKNYYGKYQI